MASPFDRLKAQLQTSGLAQQNNALFQVISQLIDLLTKFQTEVLGTTSAPIVPGTSTITNITQIIQQLLLTGDDDGEGGDTIPGPKGESGANGMVPYYIAPSEKFTVPLYKQALFSMNIDNEGILEIDGFLIEVD